MMISKSVSPSKGNRVSPMWSYFTDMVEPWKLKSAVCKHCLKTVKYHKKNEHASAHLKSCAAFKLYCNS